MVRVFAPWSVGLDGFLFFGIVAVEGITVRIDEFDRVLELCYR